MKCKLVAVLMLLGVVLPAFAVPARHALEAHIMRAAVEQQKQHEEDFSAQFNTLRKQYPAYKQEITEIEKAHEQLLKDAQKSLTLAYHNVHYMRHMVPTLENLYNATETVKNATVKKACIKLLNHAYKYSTVRDEPSTYSYRANLKHVAEVAIAEEADYTHQTFVPVWAKWYEQFDWAPSSK